MSSEDIGRARRAWERQLRAQGLRALDALTLSMEGATQQGHELEIRLAAQDPVKWYGPNSYEAHMDPAELADEAARQIAATRARFDEAQRARFAQAQAQAGAKPPQPTTPAAQHTEPETGL